MPAKYLQFLAVASIAIFGCSLTLPTVNALAAPEAHALRRHVTHGQIAKGLNKKRARSNKKRCLPRNAAPNANPAAATTTTQGIDSTTSTQGSDSSTTDYGQGTQTSTTDSSQSTPTTDDSTQGSGSTTNTVNNNPPANDNPPAVIPATYTPPAVTNNPSSGAKVGLTWTGNCDGIDAYKTSHVSWYYNWNEATSCTTSGLDYVPMLWGLAYDKVTAFNSVMSNSFYNNVLAFNEPNEGGQSNLDPSTAARGYIDNHFLSLRARGTRVGCPVTSSNPAGLQWVQDFLSACRAIDPTCDCDFMPLHYYDTTPEGFIAYVNLWHNTFGKNIWITEFACQNYNNNGLSGCDDGQVWNFWHTATAFFEATPWVERYAGFGTIPQISDITPNNALMQLSGGYSNNPPTALGFRYINANI